MWFLRLSCFLGLTGICAGSSDPAWAPLDRAFAAARVRDYETAIGAFREAAKAAPTRADIRKNFGYVLLKAGETEQARDEFAEAMRLDPADTHIALEFAFLAYETKQPAVARRVFDRIRRQGNPVAERAFQNIDRQLHEGIERWTRAVQIAPGTFSAHEELARLAEQRDEWDLAIEHYREAWRLRPSQRDMLLAIGRVSQAMGRAEDAHAALLAASRGAEPRVAEAARELLPARYPWVYEFQAALALDPGNLALRRELAWLHLEMGQKSEAEAAFRQIVAANPADAWSLAQLGFLLLQRNQVAEAMPLLDRALEKADDDDLRDRIRETLQLPKTLRKRPETPRAQTSAHALQMARKSLDAGYLKDAIRYLRIAHENDPLDFSVMLTLGASYNNLKDDRQAVDWLSLARRSPDTAIASEADRAWRNLSPQFARFRTSSWVFPFYSSRWRDVFTYAQVQTELMPRWRVRPYLSARFSGDTRRTLAPVSAGGMPAYLSDTAVILAGGVRTNTWHAVRAWLETGAAVSYLRREGENRVRPDIRGGLAWSRSIGEGKGWFSEWNADAVFVSRFDNDTLVYAQTRTGFRAGAQFYWNLNLTADAKRYQWANSVETGPGIRLRLTSVLLSIDALKGVHTVLDGTRPPRYSDLRIGLWYAATH